MSNLAEYIKEVGGGASAQGILEGLMDGNEGKSPAEGTDSYSKAMAAAAADLAADPAQLQRENVLRQA
jgi:hypothetical protein